MALQPEFAAHLASGTTTVCRAWKVTRKDGPVLGFTDHDMDLSFDGVTFRAETGLSARAIQQGTGLSVDNSEAVGLLSDSAIREEDIQAGRFDDAEVIAWLVNWANPVERQLQFKGFLGEITRAGGAFNAELRGLTERLNVPRGRLYQAGCSAVLGDGSCKVNLAAGQFRHEGPVTAIERRKLFRFAGLVGFSERWFERGLLEVLSGPAQGLSARVKNDRIDGDLRVVETWEALGVEPGAGDTVRLTAGCDQRAETCKYKFANFVNFQGFPHIPGEDWLLAYPSSDQDMSGGSLEGQDGY